ncbi:MAG: hypothetical protein ABIR53_00540 [Paraperlucidibaca sp.]
MPLTAKAHALPLEPELAERLARFQPPASTQAPSPDATLYVGWFNTKPIAAAWALGADNARHLSGFAIHPATRGRDVLAQLVAAMRIQECGAGRRVLSSDEYAAVDKSI